MSDVSDHRYALYLHDIFGKDVPCSDDLVVAIRMIKACSEAELIFPIAFRRKRTLWFCHGFVEQGANSEYILSTRVVRHVNRISISADARFGTESERKAGFRACRTFNARAGAEREDIMTGFLRATAGATDHDSKRMLLKCLALYG